jgi:hypothetical protein
MAMDEDKFWSIIAEARAELELHEAELGELYNVLFARLEAMEAEEVAEFQQQMLAQYCKAFDYRIIGAAYVIVGENCDEDDQHGFRGWLIAEGEEFFKKTLENPDFLADENVVPSRTYMPEIIGVGSQVYEQATGELPPADPDFELPAQPAGEEFDLTELPQRLPNLCDEWGFEIDLPTESEEEQLDPVEAMLALVDNQVEQAAAEDASQEPKSDETPE